MATRKNHAFEPLKLSIRRAQKDQRTIKVSGTGSLSTEEIEHLVINAVETPHFQPPLLPDVVVELVALARDPAINYRKIEKVVSRDSVIAAKIVSSANSAYYSRGMRVESLHVAISRLGVGQIRDVAFQAAVNAKVFKVPGYDHVMHDERRHALAVGLLSREVCTNIGFDPEQAFLCGLLHDIGKTIALGILTDWWRLHKLEPLPHETLYPSLDRLHSTVGARVCALWGLSPSLRNAVFSHHTPFEKGQLDQLGAVVAVADRCALHAGIGRTTQPSNGMEQVFYLLNLNPKQVSELLRQASHLDSLLNSMV